MYICNKDHVQAKWIKWKCALKWMGGFIKMYAWLYCALEWPILGAFMCVFKNSPESPRGNLWLEATDIHIFRIRLVRHAKRFDCRAEKLFFQYIDGPHYYAYYACTEQILVNVCVCKAGKIWRLYSDNTRTPTNQSQKIWIQSVCHSWAHYKLCCVCWMMDNAFKYVNHSCCWCCCYYYYYYCFSLSPSSNKRRVVITSILRSR